MITKLNDFFEFSKEIINLRSKKQEILASNIANVDTSNYKFKNLNFYKKVKKIIKNTNWGSDEKSKKNFEVNKLIVDPVSYIKKKKNTLKKNNFKKKVDIDEQKTFFLENSLKYQIEIAFFNSYIKNIKNILKG